jgi:hypothetical protein
MKRSASKDAAELRDILRRSPKLMVNYKGGMFILGLEFPRHRDYFCRTVLDAVHAIDMEEGTTMTTARIINAGDKKPGQGFYALAKKHYQFTDEEEFWKSQLPVDPKEMTIIMTLKK